MSRSPKTPDFETAMKKLEAIVHQIESGELSLEKSLELYEQGVKLAGECKKALSQAEQKIAILTNLDDKDAVLEDFEGSDGLDELDEPH